MLVSLERPWEAQQTMGLFGYGKQARLDRDTIICVLDLRFIPIMLCLKKPFFASFQTTLEVYRNVWNVDETLFIAIVEHKSLRHYKRDTETQYNGTGWPKLQSLCDLDLARSGTIVPSITRWYQIHLDFVNQKLQPNQARGTSSPSLPVQNYRCQHTCSTAELTKD